MVAIREYIVEFTIKNGKYQLSIMSILSFVISVDVWFGKKNKKQIQYHLFNGFHMRIIIEKTSDLSSLIECLILLQSPTFIISKISLINLQTHCYGLICWKEK